MILFSSKFLKYINSQLPPEKAKKVLNEVIAHEVRHLNNNDLGLSLALKNKDIQFGHSSEPITGEQIT
jgi:predicted SprT family Zn-dependent metalloprotease